MALACTDDTSDRFYSMSSQIETERKAYYRELETAQRGDMDITRWLTWFLGCLDRHGASRHSRTAGQGHPGAKPWRRPQHELPTRFAGQRGCVIAARRTTSSAAATHAAQPVSGMGCRRRRRRPWAEAPRKDCSKTRRRACTQRRPVRAPAISLSLGSMAHALAARSEAIACCISESVASMKPSARRKHSVRSYELGTDGDTARPCGAPGTSGQCVHACESVAEHPILGFAKNKTVIPAKNGPTPGRRVLARHEVCVRLQFRQWRRSATPAPLNSRRHPNWALTA